MLWRLSRRLLRFRLVTIRYLLTAFVVWALLDVLLVRYRANRAAQDFRAQGILRKPLRVYITSLHWNNEGILRDFWNSAVADLVTALGPSNVFISIHESGSWDDSKGALRELDRTLDTMGVARKITLDQTTHADEISTPPGVQGHGWIKTPRGSIELRRIPYLSRLRNMSLQPLLDLAENGTAFDYVLFLNDVVFEV